jgi:hypothetical protein
LWLSSGALAQHTQGPEFHPQYLEEKEVTSFSQTPQGILELLAPHNWLYHEARGSSFSTSQSVSQSSALDYLGVVG